MRRIAVALAVALPALVLRLSGVHLPPPAAIAVFGSAVVASAFLLVWAAEAAQRDISGSLATAILAVIAVLPEYAVDLYFAWSAGHIPQNAHYAAANMTGSNRLLLGLGWPFVVLLFVLGGRQGGRRPSGIALRNNRRVELGFLAAASLYSLVVPFTRRIAWYDSVVLLAIFFVYLWRAAGGEHAEPRLVGVAKRIGDLLPPARRATVIGLMLGATAFVTIAAGPFAAALVEGGRRLGIDEFLLVQWLAAVSSGSPALLVAAVLLIQRRRELPRIVRATLTPAPSPPPA